MVIVQNHLQLILRSRLTGASYREIDYDSATIVRREDGDFMTVASKSRNISRDVETLPRTGAWTLVDIEESFPNYTITARYRRTVHEETLLEKATSSEYLKTLIRLIVGGTLRFTGGDELQADTFAVDNNLLQKIIWQLRKEPDVHVPDSVKVSNDEPNATQLARIEEGRPLVALLVTSLAEVDSWRGAVQTFNRFGLGVRIHPTGDDFALVDMSQAPGAWPLSLSTNVENYNIKRSGQDNPADLNIRQQISPDSVISIINGMPQPRTVAGETVPHWHQYPDRITYPDPMTYDRENIPIPNPANARVVDGLVDSLAQARVEIALQRRALMQQRNKANFTILPNLAIQAHDHVTFRGRTYGVLESRITYSGEARPTMTLRTYRIDPVPFG